MCVGESKTRTYLFINADRLNDMNVVKEIITKKINGVELPHYENRKWVNLPWYPKHEIQRYLNEGYVKCEGSDSLYEKTEFAPMYRSQCPNIKYLGDEPRNCSFSIHNPQTYTKYYAVPKSDYENMAVKPTLENVCRPARYHNFDGFVEPIQEELRGKGWEEWDVVNYHATFRYVMILTED